MMPRAAGELRRAPGPSSSSADDVDDARRRSARCGPTRSVRAGRESVTRIRLRRPISTATPAPARPNRVSTLPSPSRQQHLERHVLERTTAAGPAGARRCRTRARPAAPGRRGRSSSNATARRSGTARRAASSRTIAQRHADRGERVVDQHRAAVGDASAPVADVGPRRRVPVRTVDVEHVDRAVDVGEGVVGEHRAGGGTRSATPAAARLARNTAWSSAASSSIPVDLLRATVVAGVRVDGDDLDAGRRRRWRARSCERPRKLPISTIVPAGRAAPSRRRTASTPGRASSSRRRRRPASMTARRSGPCALRRHRRRDRRRRPSSSPRNCSSTVAGEDLLGRGAVDPVRARAGSAAAPISIGTIDSS